MNYFYVCSYSRYILLTIWIWFFPVCQAQLGMESGEIADYQISASSQKTSSDAHRARLDRTPPTGNSRWCAAGVRGQYIEVDLLRITKITGFVCFDIFCLLVISRIQTYTLKKPRPLNYAESVSFDRLCLPERRDVKTSYRT